MLGWRPELRFYEKRLEILRHLEETGAMWAFRAEEAIAAARLFDAWHQLAVRQDRASLYLLAPDTNADAGWAAFEHAVGVIEPRVPRNMVVSFQFLVPLDLSLNEAIGRGNQRIITPLESGKIETGDWAILLDLTLPTEEAAGQTEFGIVEPEEVPERFARTAGRVSFMDPPQVSAALWEDEAFPSVSLFADISFYRSVGEKDADTLVAVRSFWDTARGEAASLVAGLKSKLVAGDTIEEVAS